MKFLYWFFYPIIFYFCYLGLFFTINQEINFSNIDFDNNNVLTISELSNSYGVRYKCYKHGTFLTYLNEIKYIDKNQCEQINIEVFSKKDGLTINETFLRYDD